MRLENNKRIARTIAAVCIAVQALVIFPHHHHTYAETLCLNIAHCIGHSPEHSQDQHAENNKCCHNHCTPEQQSASGHECTVKIDAAQVVSEYSCRAILGEIAVINDFFAPELIIMPEQLCMLHSFSLTQWRQQPFPVERYALFIAEALSVRAPSSRSV